MRQPPKFVWRGNHHAYYGIFFMAFGIFNYWMGIPNYPMNEMLWFWQLLASIGFIMLADDVIEHKVTRDTPLYLIFEKIIIPALKKKGGE